MNPFNFVQGSSRVYRGMKKIFFSGITIGLIHLFNFGFSQGQFEKIAVLLNEEKYSETIKLLETMPDSIEKKLSLAIIYLQTEKYNDAERSLKEIVAVFPDSIPARYNLAMLYEKKGQYKEAVIEWKMVLSLTADKNLRDLSQKHIRQLERITK